MRVSKEYCAHKAVGVYIVLTKQEARDLQSIATLDVAIWAEFEGAERMRVHRLLGSLQDDLSEILEGE